VLKALDPALVSPGLLALVSEGAPTRAILCAGAGHFATANITLTQGVRIGGAEDSGEQLIARWAEAADRTGEAVPAFGFQQAAQEMASAGVEEPVTS
ncbi:MAG TPA: 3-hydroxyacyl-CoA dehydrogenase, partial [Brevundimonas sp.]|nr:3-hydroxyacyl-CoA dehydrogenase [Brevundimonas sp.]